MLSDEEKSVLAHGELHGQESSGTMAMRLARSRLAYRKAREAAMLYRDASPIHDTKDANSLLAAAEQLAKEQA